MEKPLDVSFQKKKKSIIKLLRTRINRKECLGFIRSELTTNISESQEDDSWYKVELRTIRRITDGRYKDESLPGKFGAYINKEW